MPWSPDNAIASRDCGTDDDSGSGSADFLASAGPGEVTRGLWTTGERTDDRICDKDLDDPNAGPGPIVPSLEGGVWLGHAGWVQDGPENHWVTFPELVGREDFSIEAVVWMFSGWADVSQGAKTWLMGMVDGGISDAAGSPWGIEHFPAGGATRETLAWIKTPSTHPSLPILDSTTGTGGLIPGQWMHIAVNYNRAPASGADVSGWVDNSEFDPVFSVNIDGRQGNVLTGQPNWVLYGTTKSEVYDAVSGGGDGSVVGLSLPYIMLGHFAVHNKLLDAGERATNSSNLVVGQYAETLQRFGPWEIFNQNGFTLRPKVDSSNLALSCKWLLPSPYLEGATVVESDEGDPDNALELNGVTVGWLKDLSGKDNHMRVDCRASYNSDSVPERAKFGITSPGPQG